MNWKKQVIGLALIFLTTAAARSFAQTNEMENLLHDFEARATAGTPGTGEEAEPVLERFAQASKESVAEALPLILNAASDPHVSVRRVAAMALWEITNRPEGRALLSTETTTLAALLIDPDIPIRKITALAIANFRPDASSPLVPALEAYLAREDAVSTIGAGVAGILMQAAPSRADSTKTIVQFMRRQDQTLKSRNDTLQSIQVSRSHDRDIGKEVAAYASDPDEQTSIHAIEVLQGMGKDVVLDNQLSLSQVAADNRRAPGVRAAATKALSAVP